MSPLSFADSPATNSFLFYFILLLNCTGNITIHSVLRPFQDYISLYEAGEISRWAKTREPREKTPGTPASRTWLVSHVVSAVPGSSDKETALLTAGSCHVITMVSALIG